MSLSRAYIKIKGVSFGSIQSKPDSMYSVSVHNTKTGKSSKFYTFRFCKRRNISVKINLTVLEQQFQTFQIQVHKIKTFTKTLIGYCVVPFNAFPLNKVCHEKLVCQMEQSTLVPMSVIFDLHISTDPSKRPYEAPAGRSTLPVFDSTAYLNTVAPLQSSHGSQDDTIMNSPLII